MGCLNVIIDSDIIFLVVSILKHHYFNLIKTTLNWRIFISQEVEEEIEDPVPEQALEEVEKAKRAWIEAARQSGKPIPTPRYRPVIYQVAR